MSVFFATGMLMLLVALGVLLIGLRAQRWRSLGPYFVGAGVVYHGVSEMLLRFGGQSSHYRSATNDQVDEWLLVVGGGLLVFATVYLAFRVTRARSQQDLAILTGDVYLPDWRILLALLVPLLVLTSRGGFTTATNAVQSGASGHLADTFLILTSSLTVISFAERYPRWVVAAVAAQLLGIGLTGQRSSPVVGMAMSLFGLLLLRRQLRPRQLLVLGGVALLLVLSLQTSREQIGRERFQQASSAQQRLSFIVEGLVAAVQGRPVSIDDAVVVNQPLGERIDGNSFGAHNLVAVQLQPQYAVGLQALRNDLLLAVPSALDKSKLQRPLEDRVEKIYIQQQLGYPVPGDFIPTVFGAAVSYTGAWGLLVVAGVLGLLYGLLDRALARRVTTARLVLGIAVLYTALVYEGSLDSDLTVIRGALLVVVTLWASDWLRRVMIAGRQRPMHAPAPALAGGRTVPTVESDAAPDAERRPAPASKGQNGA